MTDGSVEKDERKKKDKEAKEKKEADILENLFYHSSISLIEADFGNIGRKIASEITSHTNFGFAMIFGLTFLPFLINNENNIWLLFVVFSSVPIFFLLKYCLKRKVQKESNHHGSLNKYFLEQIKKAKKDTAFIWWRRLVTITPFNIRMMWWWVLIIGIIGIHLATINHVNNAHSTKYYALYLLDHKIDYDVVFYFVKEFLQLLIITIVAFIATNIINELIIMRGKYVEGQEDMKRLGAQIDNAIQGMDKVEKTLELLPSGKEIVEFQNEIKKQGGTILSSLSNKFLKNIAEVSKKLREKIKLSEEKIVKISLISAYNKLLENQAARIETGSDIFTEWSNLGAISIELTNRTVEILSDYNSNHEDSKLEIYALQLKTPFEFLEKYCDCDDDKQWRGFINGNINIRDKKLLKRYFVAISEKDKIKSKYKILKSKEPPTEIDRLDKYEIQSGLKKKFFFNTHSLENLNDKNFGEAVVFHASNDGNQSKTVSDILGKIVHTKDNCFIREFNQQDFTQLLIDCKTNDDIGNQTKYTNKLIDYFAIRRINENSSKSEWIFCVRSLYDQDFDIAKISFHYESNNNSSNWNRLKAKLNQIFFLGQQCGTKLCCILNPAGSCKIDYCHCDYKKGDKIIENRRIYNISEYYIP